MAAIADTVGSHWRFSVTTVCSIATLLAIFQPFFGMRESLALLKQSAETQEKDLRGLRKEFNAFNAGFHSLSLEINGMHKDQNHFMALLAIAAAVAVAKRPR
jgi:hypothetical protein